LNIIDYYFCCNVVNGASLAWAINNDGAGREFRHEDLNEVRTGSMSTYNYTASLLSVQGSQDGYRFDSILVISTSAPLELTVYCINGGTGNINTTTND